jgi:hypothetical protein
MRFPLLRGPIRHLKLIGEDPRFKELRARNEARLAALKKADRLYEEKREPATNKLSAYANVDLKQLAIQQLNAANQQCGIGGAPGHGGYDASGYGLADYFACFRPDRHK